MHNFFTLRLREEIEKTQGGISAVAKYLEVSRATIYNWIEKGNIPANKLSELIILGIDIQYIFTGQNQIPPYTPVALAGPPSLLEKIDESLKKLKPEQKQ
jgi:DNA-binding XRE family transcriptional regulator